MIGPAWSRDRVALLVIFVVAGGLVQAGHLGVLLAHGRVQAGTAQSILQRLRQQLFHHVQSLALSHHTRTPTGATVYHLESDTGCLEHLIFRALFPIAFSALTLIVMLAILGRVAPRLAAVTASVIPVLYVIVRSHTAQMAARVETVKTLESETSGHLHESLSGIALVKSLAREQHEVGRFSERAARTISARLALTRAETRFAFLIGLVTAAGSAGTLGLGGYQVLRGELSLGTLFVVLAYMGFVYGPMSVIANIAGALQGALVSVSRVRGTLALPPERGTGLRPGRRPVTSASPTSASPTATGRCSSTSRSTSRRARWWRSSGRPALARRRSSAWSTASTTPRPASSGSTDATCGATPLTRCAAASRWCCSRPSSSPDRSPRTSATAGSTPPTRRWKRRRARRTRTSSSWRCGTATPPRWTTPARRCRAASGSGSASRARS